MKVQWNRILNGKQTKKKTQYFYNIKKNVRKWKKEKTNQ